MNIKIIILRKRNQTQGCLMPNCFTQHDYIYELYIYIYLFIIIYGGILLWQPKKLIQKTLCLLKLVKLHLK